MSEVPDDAALNPALELVELLRPWAKMPANHTVLDVRGGEIYWPNHSRANYLLDEVSRYLAERAELTGRAPSGQAMLQSLWRDINSPGNGLSSYQGSAWIAIPENHLGWLEMVGQQWDRHRLAPHGEALQEIIGLVRSLEDVITEASNVSDTHRTYMLDLCHGVAQAARQSRRDGEAPTARLAFELIGVLETFIPTQEEEPRNLLYRMKSKAGELLVSTTTQAVVELVSAGVTRAIGA